MGKKILVTGGTGYIGSHTVVELINAGYEPIIIDDLSNSSLSSLDGIETITGVRPEFHQFNLQDPELLEAFYASHQDIAVVIHFAAFKAVGESISRPLDYYQNNVGSLMNLIKVAGPTLKLVFSSSCTVYGEPDLLPVPKKHLLKRQNHLMGIRNKFVKRFLNSVQRLQNYV